MASIKKCVGNATISFLLFLTGIISLAFCEQKELLSSAELYTKEGVKYGRYEVRMRMVAADGVISSFFLWKDGSEKDDAFWNEIDIEVLGCSPGGFQSAIHAGTGGWSNMTHEESFHHLNKPLTTQYNTLAIEWTPDYICWKLNDSLVRKDTGEIVTKFRNVPMQLRFNIWPSLQTSWAGAFDPEVLPKHMYINWIKYYKFTPDKDSMFTLAWEDNFDTDTLNQRWFTGFWESPDKASTHLDKNVSINNGVAILTLSKLALYGFHGIIPQDNAGGTTFPKELSRGRGR
jgi:beta-glucanase (GH16 family)